MKKRIAAVIFDLDETLLDRSASIRAFIEEQYVRFLPQLAHIPRERFENSFLALDGFGYTPRQEVYEQLVDELDVAVTAAQFVVDFRENGWRTCLLFPRTRELLQKLRSNGYRTAIITNGSTHSQQAKMERTGLATLVDEVLISEKEGIRKPDPKIFYRACERLCVEPSACLFVGDHPEADISGAQTVGMRTVWRKGHLPWPQDFHLQPDYSIDEISELVEFRLFGL
ncbi:MAG: HAD-IA family hydrolase [Caldilineaceae bacterium]|nr:HAD-IA family hydrolase [Caldilineaceae bacterium]